MPSATRHPAHLSRGLTYLEEPLGTPLDLDASRVGSVEDDHLPVGRPSGILFFTGLSESAQAASVRVENVQVIQTGLRVR